MYCKCCVPLSNPVFGCIKLTPCAIWQLRCLTCPCTRYALGSFSYLAHNFTAFFPSLSLIMNMHFQEHVYTQDTVLGWQTVSCKCMRQKEAMLSLRPHVPSSVKSRFKRQNLFSYRIRTCDWWIVKA